MSQAHEITRPEDEWHIADFTERSYAEIIEQTLRNYAFEPYGTTTEQKHVLWRHDVDISLQRALRLAQIEQENGVSSTYFLLLHSEFYNCMDAYSRAAIQEIKELGHRFGLHFDSAFYPAPEGLEDLESFIELERNFIEASFGIRLEAVSFHNPEVGGILRFDESKIAGLYNTYGKPLKERYEYVSDSNGYWRHKRLADVVSSGSAQRLQVLTHPVWWTPTPMMPRERIRRALDGRTQRVGLGYDRFLEQAGRHNVRT